MPLETFATIFEDEDVLVLEKPRGLAVHLGNKPDEITLVDFLLKKYPLIKNVGENPIRPGLFHRLDKEVSGVMVVAKNQQAFVGLKEQFMQRLTQKEYRAIVHGILPQKTGVIKFRIAHSKTRGGKMAARPENCKGKEAWTEYEVLKEKNRRYSELKVTIKTGRTHQIRAHLAAIDHPLVGDSLYFSKKYQNKKEYPRLFLHAYRLSFAHPTHGQKMIFQANTPKEFEVFLSS